MFHLLLAFFFSISAQEPVKTVEPFEKWSDQAVDAAPRARPEPAGVPAVDRSQVHVRRTDDGRIWVHGKSWKASFGPEGTTHVPFFGSDAPRNYPIRFSIESLAQGGGAFAFDAGAPPSIDGDRVSFDRGSVVERWDLAPDAVEQSFVFDSLPSAGDLVLRIAVASDLAPFAAASGIEFSNDLGQVLYGKATVLDAAGRSAPVETLFEDGAIEMRVPGSFLEGAAFPITVDPVVRVFTVFWSPNYSCHEADVAYDLTNDRYLVVFEENFSATDHDVLSSLRRTDGSELITLYVDTTDEYWAAPKVANNNLADQFLVVAMVSASGSPPWIIRGATQLASTAAIGAPFTISRAESGSKGFPDVGGDPALDGPTYYCVVWQSEIDQTDIDVYYQLVRANGTLVFPQTLVVDNTTATIDLIPRISKSDGGAPYDTQRWNIVWLRRFSATDYDVRGAQVGWDGTMRSPSFSIDATTEDDHGAVASSLHDGASGERDWTVAFQRRVGGDWDILGYALNGSGRITGITSFSQLEFLAGSGTYTEDQIVPGLDSDGSKFVLTYSESVGNDPFNTDPCVASFDLVGSSLRLTEGHGNPVSSGNKEIGLNVVSQRSSGGDPGRTAIVWTAWTTTYHGSIDAAYYDVPLFQAFCFPGRDARPCPCGNPPSANGRGCQNSAGTGGAVLAAGGTPVNERVVLYASAMRPSSLCVFLQASTASTPGFAYGDGVRCSTGVVKRLYLKSASTGSATAPQAGDPSIPARSAEKGDVILPGSTRCYQVYYRDPADFACAAPLGFNTTNAILVDW